MTNSVDEVKGLNKDGLPSRFRTLTGIARYIQIFVSLAIVILGILFILGIHIYLNVPIFKEQWIGLFLSLFLILTFISVPISKQASRACLPWYDILLSVLALPAGLWITIYYPSITTRLGFVTPERMIFGALAILLVLEAGRRMVGTTLVAIGLFFILYAKFSIILPGFIQGLDITWGEELNYLYLDPNSMLNMLGLAATFGLAFVFFGQILLKFGGGEALTNLALLMFGKARGGPAKAAVIGSSLVGTVTGAPMSNVFLTGTISIPMMIRTGYSPRFAGAVEAVASSGGQIMPPVMGIAAFLIAESMGVAYAKVAAAALIPAILFYVAVFVQVDLEAGKLGLRGLRKDELPKVRQTLIESLPSIFVLGIMIYLMFIRGIEPASAGIFTALIAIPVLSVLKENRKDTGKKIFAALEGTGRLMLDVSSALGIAGLVVGAISVSGLGFTLGYLLTLIGKNSMILLLLAAAGGSIILGMGMPSVAAYALVAVLVAPALVNFGINPMAAHLFIFYFSIVSNFTPPIAVAAFAAAALAGSDPMKTGLTATRLGILSFIIPFMFVFFPSLILQGKPDVIALTFITSCLGTVLLGAGLTGFLFSRISAIFRVVFAASGVLLMFPVKGFGWLLALNFLGLILAVGSVVMNYRKKKLETQLEAGVNR